MSQSIVFIDRRVSNYETLVAGLGADTTWYLLSAEQDGITQMQRILAGYSGLDSIHVVSHGSPGAIYLGSTELNADNLANYASQLQEIGASLSQAGDILLYGCNVGAGTVGARFVADLAAATSADVAASIDATGPAALGGDGVLERSAGVVDAPVLDVSKLSDRLAVEDALTESDLRVNTTSVGDQSRQTIGQLADGGYVVTWMSRDGILSAQGNPITKIVAQRFNADGVSVGGEFEVSRVEVGNAYCDLPDVAGLSNGGFIVTWTVQGDANIDGSESGVVGQRYSVSGAKVGSEFIVNTTTQGRQEDAEVAGLADGGFAVAWQQYPDQISVQRFDASGNKVGLEVCFHGGSPSIFALSNGGYVVSNTWDGIGHFQVFRADGQPAGVQIEVGCSTPQFAELSAGGFAVVWHGRAGNSGGSAIYGKIFNPDFSPAGSTFAINQYEQWGGEEPRVVSLEDGSFAVVWNANGSSATDHSSYSIQGRFLSETGAPLGDQFQVNQYGDATQMEAAIAKQGDGIVVTWTSEGQDGSGAGIYSHPVIHNSDPAGLARIPYAFDKDGHILQAQPD